MLRRNNRIPQHFSLMLMLAGFVLIQIFNPIKFGAMVSLGTWIIVFSCAIVPIKRIVEKQKLHTQSLVLLGLIAISFLSMFMAEDFSYSAIVALVCFLEIPITMCAYTDSMDNRIKRAIYGVFWGVTVLYFLLSISPLAYLYTTRWGTSPISELTLSYNNPNETAMYLFTSLIILTSYLYDYESKKARFAVAIGIAFIIYLILLTRSRTALFTAFTYILFIFIYRKRRIPSCFPIAFVFGSICFIILSYVIGDYVFLGESFDTGRLDIYKRVFSRLDAVKLFVGDFSFKFQNLHSAVISIFATIGILGAVAFYYILVNRAKDLNETSIAAESNKYAYMGLLFLIVYTATEAAFFTAGSAFAVCFLSVYFLCLPTETQSQLE